MIHKPIDKITKADIDALIEDQVMESRTIEYKEKLPGNSDDDKKEFLADVSAFANASGGDLIYGIRETDDDKIEAIGLVIDNDINSERLRLHNIIQNGLDPCVSGIQIEPIAGFPQGPVLLIRIPQSWSAPHMVTFKNSSKFFARNSAGKNQMDVSEIRNSFLLSESLTEKIKRFREDRVAKINDNDGAAPLAGNAKIIVHVVPLASFSRNLMINISDLIKETNYIHPIGKTYSISRLNIDGVLKQVFKNDDGINTNAYCQIYRNGIIESVSSNFINNANLVMEGTVHEKKIAEDLEIYLQTYNRINIPFPVHIMVSYVGVLGYRIFYHNPLKEIKDFAPIDRDNLFLPDIMIEDYSANLYKELHPIFDALWNASGIPSSPSYDKDGNWLRD